MFENAYERNIPNNWSLAACEVLPTGEDRTTYVCGNYAIFVHEASYMPGGLKIDVCVCSGRFVPEINVGSAWGAKVQTVSIRSTSWGSLSISEIDEVVAGYNEAKAMAYEIEQTFPQCFKENR